MRHGNKNNHLGLRHHLDYCFGRQHHLHHQQKFGYCLVVLDVHLDHLLFSGNHHPKRFGLDLVYFHFDRK